MRRNGDGMHKSTSVKALLVGGATIAATMIPLAGTSYAASCYSLTCDNLGPVTYTCDDDGIEARRVESSDRVARLIWSSKCQAAWVHVKGTQGSIYNSYGYIERYNSSGTVLQKSLSVAIPTGPRPTGRTCSVTPTLAICSESASVSRGTSTRSSALRSTDLRLKWAGR